MKGVMFLKLKLIQIFTILLGAICLQLVKQMKNHPSTYKKHTDKIIRRQSPTG
uniref:Uncharacterized protein n=1 Tax=Anguilla anguilla TaxID=7936 RepID=A0A0E9Q5E6_ANGAN